MKWLQDFTRLQQREVDRREIDKEERQVEWAKTYLPPRVGGLLTRASAQDGGQVSADVYADAEGAERPSEILTKDHDSQSGAGEYWGETSEPVRVTDRSNRPEPTSDLPDTRRGKHDFSDVGAT